ncbi:MAG: hypothetical protein ACKOA0_08600 [Burkholderiaceae bacterium]
MTTSSMLVLLLKLTPMEVPLIKIVSTLPAVKLDPIKVLIFAAAVTPVFADCRLIAAAIEIALDALVDEFVVATVLVSSELNAAPIV